MPPTNPNPSPDVLVIFDRSLGSLCAAWASGVAGASETPGRTLAWLPPAIAADPARESAARSLAEACRAEVVTGPAPTWPAGLAQTGLLLAAGAAALERGVGRVVWPVRLGEPSGGPGGSAPARGAGGSPLPAVAAAFDRALLVGRLLSMDAGALSVAGVATGGLTIETPYLDLTADQLADLALDMDVPATLLNPLLPARARG